MSNPTTNALDPNSFDLTSFKELFVQQKHELGEFIGFETRNKYQISTSSGQAVGFAAEQSKGFFGFIARQMLGHWRSFEVHVFDNARRHVLVAKHPFRFYFHRLEVYNNGGKILGAIQKRFSILSKRFDVENARGDVILEVSSPIWKIWTFPFRHNGKDIAFVKKKWSGAFSEMLTDRDNFMVEFTDPSLKNDERQIILASAIFVDLMYFEHKK